MNKLPFVNAALCVVLALPLAALAGDLQPPGPPAPTMRTLDSLGFDCPNDPPGTTNLLFSFVTNQAGFDTGFTIANTGADPFGTAGRTGTCTLNFYGSDAAPPLPPPYTTPSIAPGAVVANIASTVAPGFQGYIVAVCDFDYAHGFALVTDGPIGLATVGSSYLATTICRDRKWNLGNGR